MITGTNGNNFMFFNGVVEAFNVTLTNPYSSEQIYFDEDKNVNSDSYDGLGGIDTLLMSSAGDVLNIVNNTNMQVLFNIERFVASDGGDVIALAHSTITYGDVNISGGAGDDVLWGNIGNDTISGASGNDIIDGGPGHDILDGGDDHDRINGGDGNDRVSGGNGNDILFGGHAVAPVTLDKSFHDNVTFPHLLEGVNIANLVPPGTNALGYADGNMTVDFPATATLTFREGFAGYNNTLGIYSIDANGQIGDVQILWANTKTAGLNVAHEIDLPVGENGGSFGFFVIANGYSANNNYAGLNIAGDNKVKFYYDYGLATQRLATVNDDGTHVKMVYQDGSINRVLNGYHYHTTERDGDTSINSDGQDHMVSGLVNIGQQDVLRIGFEDLPNLGDADYEDVFFDFNVNEVIIEGDSEDGNDVLIGGAGNDILYGQDGNDILIIGDGGDDAYGGRGSDQFVFDVFDNHVDTIHDFGLGAGNDVLNITDILEGYDALSDNLANFVQVLKLNGDTHININADGVGTDYAQMVVLTGVETTLADLINNGNLVANQSVVV
jgi:Ca2+-binding RTX toxin-like protein